MQIKPNKNRMRVAVMYGGKSGEHEVSILSASSVIGHLDPTKYEVIPVGIDKEGQWNRNTLDDVYDRESHQLRIQNHFSKPITTLRSDDCDVIFPVLHGPLYEDGCLQGQLELIGLPYVGSGVLASAMAMNKYMTKRLAETMGIPVVPYQSLSAVDWQSHRQDCVALIEREIGYPLFVKPDNLGSSVGIHKVKHADELAAAMDDALQYDHKILIEKALNAREIEIAVIENYEIVSQPLCSVIGEIILDKKYEFYDYTAKYLDPESLCLQIPAEISETQANQIREYAQKVFTLIACEGYARVDFFIEKISGQVYFNELNTIPGFTTMSMFPLLWTKTSLPYSDLLDRLISLACFRHQKTQQIKRQWVV
jgi:D-alanine-D-alanine ligase